MDTNELIGELLDGLTNDVKALKTQLAKLPTQAPVDYRPQLEALARSVQELPGKLAPPAAAVDLSPVLSRLDRIEHQQRQRPEYRMSEYVRYGGYAFGVMVVLLATMTWLALSWRSERDEYAQAYSHDNWRVRYTRQANPEYYSFMEAKFKDAELIKWIREQEEADERRELARQAQEQAKAMNAQADQLEGKARPAKRKGR